MTILGTSTYNFMCGMKPADIVSAEVTDCDVKLILVKVQTNYVYILLCVCV